MRDWNTVFGDKSWHNAVGPYGMGRKKSEVECSSNFMKYMDLLPPTHGVKGLREDRTPGKHQESDINISRTVYLWNSDSETIRRMCRHCLEQI